MEANLQSRSRPQSSAPPIGHRRIDIQVGHGGGQIVDVTFEDDGDAHQLNPVVERGQRLLPAV